jgi:zinc finger protein 830
MADVRSLLKNARAARRIQHKHASYSTTGTLLCTACHLQLKSETLWEGHLRSTGHLLRAEKQQEAEQAAAPPAERTPPRDENPRKRRASGGEDTIRKRARAAPGLPAGFFDAAAAAVPAPAPVLATRSEMQIPSRPATPLAAPPARPGVDEDEWAAFEADVAAADAPAAVSAAGVSAAGVISAPAMSAAALAAAAQEADHTRRRARQEAEREGDKEDAARKREEEFEEMEGLEQRVRRLREKREALRQKEPVVTAAAAAVTEGVVGEDLDDEEDDDDDDWDGFRMKG